MKTYFKLWKKLKDDLVHSHAGRMVAIGVLFMTLHSVITDLIVAYPTMSQAGMATDEIGAFAASVLIGYIMHTTASIAFLLMVIAVVLIPVAIFYASKDKRSRKKANNNKVDTVILEEKEKEVK